MKLIDGKVLAHNREIKLKRRIFRLKATPKVVSIVIGTDPASLLYTRMKQKKAQDVGIVFKPEYFPEKTKYREVVDFIEKLNSNPKVNGIMVQLPLPEKFLKDHTEQELLNLIDKKKDIDGLTSNPIFIPATAVAVISILEDEKVPIKNTKITILGRSPLVGKPVADELKKRGAQVEVVHSKTQNPRKMVLRADVVISAVGKPYLVKGDWIKKGAIVVDVGTSVYKGKIVGDVEFEKAKEKVSKITPVPGGVGPMTVISLMENVLKSTKYGSR